MTDSENVMSNVGKITRRLPLVSAKNPHKCDEQMTPTNAAPAKIPKMKPNRIPLIVVLTLKLKGLIYWN